MAESSRAAAPAGALRTSQRERWQGPDRKDLAADCRSSTGRPDRTHRWGNPGPPGRTHSVQRGRCGSPGHRLRTYNGSSSRGSGALRLPRMGPASSSGQNYSHNTADPHNPIPSPHPACTLRTSAHRWVQPFPDLLHTDRTTAPDYSADCISHSPTDRTSRSACARRTSPVAPCCWSISGVLVSPNCPSVNVYVPIFWPSKTRRRTSGRQQPPSLPGRAGADQAQQAIDVPAVDEIWQLSFSPPAHGLERNRLLSALASRTICKECD